MVEQPPEKKPEEMSQKEYDQWVREFVKGQQEEARRKYEEQLELCEEGNVRQFRVDASEEKTKWFLYEDYDHPLAKYKLIYTDIPWEENLRITRKAWSESGQDLKLFSMLYQVELMKRTWKKVGDVAVDASFWINYDPRIIESIREQMYGAHGLSTDEDAEMLKNSMRELFGLLKSSMPGLESLTQTSTKTEEHLPSSSPPSTTL